MGKAFAIALLTAAGSFSTLASDDNAALGEKLFVQCAGCHWVNGEGSEALGAPNLTTLDQTYLVRQLKSFANERRGSHPTDDFGSQMVLFAKALRGGQNIQAVSDYIVALPDHLPATSDPEGNMETGAKLYASCATCHGAKAQGLVTFGAPNLTGLQDWYLQRQLLLFRNKARPSAGGDPYALQMAAAVQTLSSDQDIKDVVAYIGSLRELLLTR